VGLGEWDRLQLETLVEAIRDSDRQAKRMNVTGDPECPVLQLHQRAFSR